MPEKDKKERNGHQEGFLIVEKGQKEEKRSSRGITDDHSYHNQTKSTYYSIFFNGFFVGPSKTSPS